MKTTVVRWTAGVLLIFCSLAAHAQTFEGTIQSLRTHEVPDWYHAAKLGIFIHWGIYSVPGWATPIGKLDDGIATETWFKNNPYAEWYLNSLKIEGSPTQRYHEETYGSEVEYYDFAETFNESIASWNPESWASLFRDAGAKYVVITTKHHDGFTLWPSDVAHPHPEGRTLHASRDIVGELTSAVNGAGLKMGLYYSGGLDWSFNSRPILLARDAVLTGFETHTPEYAAYVDAHWRELIERYRPAILWNDISYPKKSELLSIIADYYNDFPDGLINDRFAISHRDTMTPEYRQLPRIAKKKWETCRGLGYSFGYNRVEGPDTVIEADALIRMFIDIVSKNGNLLLNVGPMANGEIPQIQQDRLRTLGEWLSINGDAIYGTHPWERAEGTTSDGIDIRFTAKGDSVYAILMQTPDKGTTTIQDFAWSENGKAEILGVGPIAYKRVKETIEVSVGTNLPSGPAHVIRFSR